MSVRATTRRERIRRPNGDRVILPGGQDATGLSALAAVSTDAVTMTGAARHAPGADVIEPAAEAVVLFDSLRGTDSYAGEATLPAGVVRSWPTVTPFTAMGARRDNAGWSVARCDVDKCDEPMTQAGTDIDASGGELDATDAPAIYTFTPALERALANAEANPAAVAWELTAAPVRVNMFPTPSTEVAGIPAVWGATPLGATLTNVATGGFAGVRHMRLTATGTFLSFSSRLFGEVKPGQSRTLQMRVKGTAGLSVFVNLRGETGASASTSVTLSAAWQLVTVTYTRPVSEAAARLFVGFSGTVAVGNVVDFDAVFVEEGAVAGAYLDPSGSLAGHTITWARGVETSPTIIAPTASGAYTRPVDAAAPQLGLPGSKWVHCRTGALSVGARISSPWQPCAYGLLPGRTFTIAAWVSVLPLGGIMPSFRWVVELIRDPADHTGSAFIVAASEPFSPADAYQRFTAVLTPTMPDLMFGAPANAVRAHLEVVDPAAAGALTSVTIRGAHLYAGPDRGDTAGLAAVPLPARVSWQVNVMTGQEYKVTRVDVHGNDRVSHITAASALIVHNGTGSGALHGASAGRLTMRVADPSTMGLCSRVDVYAEETNAGPGGQLSLQMVQLWHEVSATADLVDLRVERASEADPEDSTIPIGNYAASTIDLTLDDALGDWSLFGRSYIDLGHRIEAAVGVTYTNRCDDPLGIDADAGGVATLTWPTAPALACPVVPVEPDQYGQIPPAPFVGHATAAFVIDTPMRVTAPALEGWTMAGQVWVRYSGGEIPELYAAGVRRYVRTGTEIAVAVDGSSVVPLPFTAPPNRWTLVKVPPVFVPAGCNAVAVSGRFLTGNVEWWLELGAPDLERIDAATGDLIEVVETAPAGVFSSTSWEAATGGEAVRVAGVDVLATSGAQVIDASVGVNTTVEAELRNVARTYLDLGSDQVRIVDPNVTKIPYAIPAEQVSTQIADLAKVATLTAFTDGAGRFTALLRSEVEPGLGATYLSDRNLVQGDTAIAPDVVRNEVTVTAHPISRTSGATLATVGNSDLTDTSAAGWELSGQEIYLPPGNTSVEVLVDWEYDGALSGVVVNPVGWFDWAVGTAAPFNPFYVEPDGTTAIDFPPGSNWGLTLTGGEAWATAAVEVFPTYGRITFTNRLADPGPGGFIPNPYAPAVWVDRVQIIGPGLRVKSVSQRFVRESSVEAFGVQSADVEVRLAQSTTPLPAIGLDVLDNYSLRDASGGRWLPDLELEVLADPWRELGDRVLVGDPDSAIAGEYRVLSHTLSVGVDATSELYLRQVPSGLVFAIADVSLADDGKVTSY